MSDPIITKEFVIFVMKDAFPGCRLKVKDRMGGITAMMAIWHYELSISVTLNTVSKADTIGETIMTLTYLPRELRAEKPSGTIILRRISTTNPDQVKEFVKNVRAYMRGIVLAINAATAEPVERKPNIFFDEFDDD